VIPSYNERENIVQLVSRILELQPSAHVLVVDDNSPDGTSALLTEAKLTLGDRFELLTRTGKGGRGSAVLAGFRRGLEGSYEVLFEMDADFSHKPEEIPLFLEKILDYDMVVGSRYLPGSEIYHWGWKRTFFSRWANRYARAVLRIPLSDYTNGFRAYRRSAIKSLDMDAIDAKGYVVLSEVAYQLFLKGARFGEVPTVFVNRRRGISNLNFREIKEAFLSVLRIRWKYGAKR
jgi:glycosyltransferase involved in cell wall biosynthesis